MWRVVAVMLAFGLIGGSLLQGYLEKANSFSIKHITLEGELTYVTQQALLQEYSHLLAQDLLSVNLDEIKKVVEASPWVDSSTVRRVWPDRLHIQVSEHKPLAYWGDGQIITAKGQIITPVVLPVLSLPHLVGPVDSQDSVLEQFGLISQVLASTSLRIETLTLAKRGAWDVQFTNDVRVYLGREEILERLQRFIAVYKTDLSGRIDQIVGVDARYPHGVAVEWRAQP